MWSSSSSNGIHTRRLLGLAPSLHWGKFRGEGRNCWIGYALVVELLWAFKWWFSAILSCSENVILLLHMVSAGFSNGSHDVNKLQRNNICNWVWQISQRNKTRAKFAAADSQVFELRHHILREWGWQCLFLFGPNCLIVLNASSCFLKSQIFYAQKLG